jgi:aspartate ammonia-lyase
VKESLRSGRTIKEIVHERKLLTEKQWNELFDPAHLTEPNLKK